MTHESMVGIAFGVLLATGFVFILFSGFNRSTGKADRPKLTSIGLGLASLAFTGFGLVGNYFVTHSARIEVVGSISKVERSGGRYPSTTLWVILRAN
jgi:hypothetical protein